VAFAVDLHAAMEHLAVEDRALLSLHHVQHFTQAEIAQIAGLPEGTVKTRLHRSRVRLRSKMEVK
jgi:RNA polymerase sigma-70 factor (ECF subfamily)